MLQYFIFLMAISVTVQVSPMNKAAVAQDGSQAGFFSKAAAWVRGTDSSTTGINVQQSNVAPQSNEPQQQPISSTTVNDSQRSSTSQQPAAPVIAVKPADEKSWVKNLFETQKPVKQSINYARLPAEERMKLKSPEEQKIQLDFEADQARIRAENAKIKEEKQLQWMEKQIKNKTLVAEGADFIAALRGEEPPSSIYRRMQNDASTADKLIQGDLQKQNETVPLKPVEPQITPEEKIKQEEEKLKQEEELKKQLEVQQITEYKQNLSKAFAAIPEGDDLAKKLDQMGPDDVKNFHQRLQDAEKMSQQEIQENHLSPGAAEQYRREVLRLRFATDLDDEGAFDKRVEKLDTIVKLDTGMRLLENQNQFSRSDKVKTDLVDLKKYNENPEAFTDQKRIDELKVWSEVAAKLGDDPEKAKDFFGTLKMSERLNNMATDPNKPFARAALNTEHKKLSDMLDGDTVLLARVVPHDIQLPQKEQKAIVTSSPLPVQEPNKYPQELKQIDERIKQQREEMKKIQRLERIPEVSQNLSPKESVEYIKLAVNSDESQTRSPAVEQRIRELEEKAGLAMKRQPPVNQQKVQATQRMYKNLADMIESDPDVKYPAAIRIYREQQTTERLLKKANKVPEKDRTNADRAVINLLNARKNSYTEKLEAIGWGRNLSAEQTQKDASTIRNRVIVGGLMATMVVAAIIWAATASSSSQKSGAGKNSNEADQRDGGETSFATMLDEGYLAPSAQQPDGQYAIHPFIAMISDQKLFGRTLTGEEQSNLSQQFNLIVTQTGNAGTLATKAMQDGRDLTADEAQKMLDYKNIVEQAEKQFFVMELDIRYSCEPHQPSHKASVFAKATTDKSADTSAWQADGKYDVIADYQRCLTVLQSQAVDIKKQLDAPTTGDGALSDAKRVMLEAAAENIVTEQFYLNKRIVLEQTARDKFAELSQNKDLSQDQKDAQFQNYYQPARQANTALIIGDGQFIARQVNEPFERSRNRRVPVLLGNEDPMPYTFVEPVTSEP